MKILVSCGEPSGDLYAGALTKSLLALEPSTRVYGLGGEKFRAAGGEPIEDYRGLTVTGLTEALSVLPRSYSIYRRLVKLAENEQPDVFVPIDFPDFNFRLADTLSQLGVPVVYYVCPQIWAWRRGRIRSMKRFVQRALVIFPFEKTLYEQEKIPVDFVGHPLLDLCHITQDKDGILRENGFDPGRPTVALLPGSRPNEVQSILPDLIKAALLIRQRIPSVQFLIARAPDLDDRLFGPLSSLLATGQPTVVLKSQTDNVLKAADFVVTASGTATVQAAIHGRPMVIVYRVSSVTYRLLRAFANVDSVGMVNLIAGHKIAPELLQDAFTPQAVCDEVVSFLLDPTRATKICRELQIVRDQLGHSGASRRVAELVLSEAHRSRSSV